MENTQNKKFIFLYPQQEIFEQKINVKLSEQEKVKFNYSKKLNSCIHYRYRLNGFSIVYALLDDSSVSDIIQLKPKDKIIYVGMDSKTHRTKKINGKYPYPNQDFILNQILPVDTLVVGGFHMWDCVEKLARRAHKKGINVLVDEDLTDFFAGRIIDKDFRIKKYPTYNPKLEGQLYFESFMQARKNKPWLFQNY